MRGVLLITVLAMAVPVRDDVPPAEDARPLQERLQGEWQMVQAVIDGQPENKRKVDETVVTIRGNQMLIREANKQKTQQGGIVVDVARNPAAIDIMPNLDELNARQVMIDLKIQGIFKIEGDVLTMCFAQNLDSSRPAAFVSAPTSHLALLQFKRIRK